MTLQSNKSPPVCWVVTDGRAGIEAQALGLAEAMARKTPLSIVAKRVRFPLPWRLLPRQALGDPFRRLDAEAAGFAPPFPDVWIGCGRASIPLTIAVKKVSPPTFTIQLQDPRAPSALFDLVIPPVHDGLAGANVLPIIGAPNRMIAGRAGATGVKSASPTKIAVLIGGPNRAFRLDGAEAIRIADQVRALAIGDVAVTVTTSRRTPPGAVEAVRRQLQGSAAKLWRAGIDEAAGNPYPAMVSDADFIMVTEDSVNMAVEAASTGTPVYILPLARRRFASARKFDLFHESLRARGATRIFGGRLERWRYDPLDETARAADEAIARWRESSRTRVR